MLARPYHGFVIDDERVREEWAYHYPHGKAARIFHQSYGTLVWFGLVGSVVEALAHGTVLLADELDASLHPNLVRQLIRLFQNPDSSPRQAQLVFNLQQPAADHLTRDLDDYIRTLPPRAVAQGLLPAEMGT